MRYIRTSEHTTFILYIDLPYLAHIEQAYRPMKFKRVTVSEAIDSELSRKRLAIAQRSVGR